MAADALSELALPLQALPETHITRGMTQHTTVLRHRIRPSTGYNRRFNDNW